MAWCTSTPSRTPPTSEMGRLAAVMGWVRGCGGWLGTGGPDPLHRLCAWQEHGAGPAVPGPAGVHRRHEFPHGFDHQRAHVRRRALPWGVGTLGTALGDVAVAVTPGPGAAPTFVLAHGHHARGGEPQSPEPCPLFLVGTSLLGIDFLPSLPKTDAPSLPRAANPSATAGCST